MAEVAVAPQGQQQVPIEVPWTEAQEDRLRELAQHEEHDQWDIGDLALAAVPMGKGTGNNQAKAYLELLAHRTGFELSQLKRNRDVANAWPHPTRVGCGSFTAHKAYTTGGPKKAPERQALFERIAASSAAIRTDPNEPLGRVTVKLVKENRPTKPKQAGSTKIERRRGAAHRAAELLSRIEAKLGPEDSERLQHALGLLGRLERDDV